MSSDSKKRKSRKRTSPPATRFPLWLAAGCLVAALVGAWTALRMYGNNTPAIPVAPAVTSTNPTSSEVALTPAQTVSAPIYRARVEQHQLALDPSHDGWTSEAVSSQIQKIMDQFGLFLQRKRPNLEGIAEAFTCESLRPANLTEAFHDPQLSVWRAPEEPNPGPVFTGEMGLRTALEQSIPGELTRWSSKVVKISLHEENVSTTHFVESLSRDDSSDVEQHRVWKCEWRLDAHRSPTLVALAAENYEEVRRATRDPWFVDHTLALLSGSEVYRQQLVHGLNYWLDRIETVHGMYAFAEYGIALGDANGDDLDDLYICQPGGLPNRLLLRNPDGTLRDAPDRCGVNWLDHTSSALFLDLDNDGDQDLVLAIENRQVLCLRNDGSGQFQLAVTLAIQDRHVQMLCAADYDLDGDVDLYLTVGHADQRARDNEVRPDFVYHDANDGGANTLFRNDITGQDWKFEDVTRSVGLDVNNRRHSLAASWCDYDNDGDPDLYVANDYGQNCLYRNDAGQFVEVAPQAGVVDFGSGMSVSWGDFDHDGRYDLYVGNMFSTAGRRIATQSQFRPDMSHETRDILARFAKGNTLFHNQGDGTFQDVSSQAAVEMGRWAWSSLFVDVNNDGWEDLFVANGYITSDLPDDL